ncbi:MAG: type II toxin-antitoxin system RelB/DinJ family antitoxin [Oscillospiraceae bacterium]|nr:type II toxin-antitoxin system RelB/DinJ family antitoxin [Oscillospiraceae bacterium]
MAMTSINVRVDENDKQLFDNFCAAVGMSMSTAINMFMKATLREQKIPFALAADPFYTEADLRRLNRAVWEEEHGVPGVRKTFEELGIV